MLLVEGQYHKQNLSRPFSLLPVGQLSCQGPGPSAFREIRDSGQIAVKEIC